MVLQFELASRKFQLSAVIPKVSVLIQLADAEQLVGLESIDLVENHDLQFSAGPSMVPAPVLRIAHAEFMNWQGTGVSVMETPHRSEAFMAFADEIEQDCRELLKLPSNYRVLFLSGGARGQFAAIPLNLA